MDGFYLRGGSMTTILAAIIRLMESIVPPPSGPQTEIDRVFDEIVAGWEQV